MASADARTLRRIAATFRPYRAQVALVLAAVVATAAVGFWNAVLVRGVLDRAIGGRDLTLLALYAAALFGLPVAGNLLGLWQSTLSARIGQNVMRDFRTRLFTHLQSMPLAFYTATRAGEINARLTHDVAGIDSAVTGTAAIAMAQIAAISGAVVAMLYMSLPLTLLSLGLLPVFLMLTRRSGKRRRALRHERQRTLAALATLVSESLSVNGALLMKTFGRQPRALDEFRRHNDDLAALEVRQQAIGRRTSFGFNSVLAAVPALIYLLAGWQMIRGAAWLGADMTMGTLVAFVSVQGRLFGPAAQLLMLQADVQAALALFDRIFEYLDLPVETADPPNAVVLAPAAARGEVRFERVSFAYLAAEAAVAAEVAMAAEAAVAVPAVADISFTIAPGQTVALVGPSGAGKSTIAHLAARLYDADDGVVAIDGHDVKDIARASLADLVGVVTQETFLLHASIRDNLLYALPQASEAELVAAAQAALIHDRILACEHGYDTVVGERGHRLSGGERQRLALARVFLKNPRILILDEATSALDPISDRLVQRALDRARRGRTTLVIAHRLSTVAEADMILVVGGGRIVERGQHADLLARDGAYARLYRGQLEPASAPDRQSSHSVA